MRGGRAIIAALVLAGALAGPAGAEGLGRMDSSRPYWAQPPELALPTIPLRPVTPPRPEIRSYQPHSGLQYGFRPEPPGQRRIRPGDADAGTRVILPKAVPPLIEYGPPPTMNGPSHTYCFDPARCP